jgi:hypothetical protein
MALKRLSTDLDREGVRGYFEAVEVVGSERWDQHIMS